MLTPNVFVELLKCGVRLFQITFDGGKEYHDKTRCDKNGRGSFETIFNNLKHILQLGLTDKFIFTIRINFMKNSLNSIYHLIDLLSEIIQNDDRFMIYCRPVYNFETSRKSIEDVESDIFSIEEGLRIQKELTTYISSKRKKIHNSSILDSLLPYTRNTWCFEDNNYSYIIGADGNVYKCDTLIGDQKFSIGVLNKGEILLNDNNTLWNKNIFDMIEFKDCWPCKLLPICFGGCKRNKIEGGNNCYFNEEFIRKNIREYINEGGEE